MNDETPFDAKAKLAASRAGLLAAMGYEQPGKDVHPMVSSAGTLVSIAPAGRTSAAAALSKKVGRSVVGRWWRRHPISSVVQIGQPFLESYARKHPAKLLAYGAGAGALLYVLKPWKLLSVATVVTLILKSSDVSGMISDAMNSSKLSDEADERNLSSRTSDALRAVHP